MYNINDILQFLSYFNTFNLPKSKYVLKSVFYFQKFGFIVFKKKKNSELVLGFSKKKLCEK